MQTDSKSWTFSEFVDATSQRLQSVKGKIVQRQEDADGTSWWLTFNRASSTYRFSFDRKSGKLLLEKGQGSFVPNSQPTWRVLESQEHVDASFESFTQVIDGMLARFR
jgi:hypothetical protein